MGLHRKLISANGQYEIPVLDSTNIKQGSVIICLHGFAGSKKSSVIGRLTSVMAESGVGVLTFDWPAHGENRAADNALTVANCLNDLDLLVKKLKREHKDVSCFATSFGGYIAILYGKSHPDAFYRTILRSPAIRMGRVFRNFVSDEEFARMEQGELLPFGSERKMFLGIEFYQDLVKNDAFYIPVSNPENVRIIQGDKDDVVFPDDTRLFAQKNGIRVEWFEGADHRYKNAGEIDRVVDIARNFILD